MSAYNIVNNEEEETKFTIDLKEGMMKMDDKE